MLFTSIPLKRKLNSNKKTVISIQIGKYVKDLCNLMLNWTSFSIITDKKVQAYNILSFLQKMTDKKYPVKFPGRKITRIKMYL
jgi:hypothetical protein